MSEPSVKTLDEKVDRYFESQDKHNDKVTNAIDKMSEAISNLNTVHTEINHLSEKHTLLDSSVDDIRKELKLMNDKLIVASIQADEFKKIKNLFIGFIVTVALGGGFMTKMSNDNSIEDKKIMSEAVSVMRDIAKSSGQGGN